MEEAENTLGHVCYTFILGYDTSPYPKPALYKGKLRFAYSDREPMPLTGDRTQLGTNAKGTQKPIFFYHQDSAICFVLCELHLNRIGLLD